VRSGDGKLWFSVLGGVAMIDPTHLAENDIPPPVFIRSLTADGKNYPIGGDLVLPKSTRAITLDYTALSLTLSERNHFRYQLVGFDTGWQDVGARRQAFYTNLAPGSYTFKVIASNNDGVWNETGTAVTFTVPPTFFQSIWFKLLLIAGTAFLVWALYALRLKQATAEIRARLGERLQERERIARELHDTLLQDFQAVILRFQIAAKRIAKEDPNRTVLEEGLDYADKVLAEGRNYIRDIRFDTKAFGDLSKSFAEYGGELAKLRPITFSIKVTGAELKLDPIVRDEVHRIGREAIGNAFNHSNGSKVEVEIAYERSEFQLKVCDDGDGIDPRLSSGGRPGHWGIQNMKERAQKIGASLTISSEQSGGTSLELRLPVRSVYGNRTSARRS
jgi:signal transduction histidine kinase